MANDSVYSGTQGPQGDQGIQGIQGTQGPAGVDGVDGADGAASSSDRQLASSATQVTTTSIAYVDLSVMTLTTKNLGETGNYIVTFNAETINASTSNRNEFILNVGGSDVAVSQRTFTTADKANGITAYGHISINHLLTNVANGTVIKVRWRVESSTGYTRNRSLVINGVPTSQVVV